MNMYIYMYIHVVSNNHVSWLIFKKVIDSICPSVLISTCFVTSVRVKWLFCLWIINLCSLPLDTVTATNLSTFRCETLDRIPTGIEDLIEWNMCSTPTHSTGKYCWTAWPAFLRTFGCSIIINFFVTSWQGSIKSLLVAPSLVSDLDGTHQDNGMKWVSNGCSLDLRTYWWCRAAIGCEFSYKMFSMGDGECS